VPSWLFRVLPPPVYHRIRRVPLLGGAVRRLFDALVPPRGLVLVRVQRGPLAGMVLELDPRTQIDIVVGRYEERVQAIVERVLQPGDSAFDIGAHLGYFTLMMGLVVGRAGRVVSFEPDPVVMEGLQRNVRRNGAQAGAEIVLVPAAVDELAGRVGFVAGRETSRGKLVAGDGDLRVETMVVDDVARQFRRPRLVKVDVEGRELGVLRGASETLGAGETVLVVEAHSRATERECRELLASFDYSCAIVRERGRAESYLVAWPSAEPSPVHGTAVSAAGERRGTLQRPRGLAGP
jgi:FkbM family methyltransferase